MFSGSCGRLSLEAQLHPLVLFAASSSGLLSLSNEDLTLYWSAKPFRTRRSRIGGFSMVELAVSLAVLMILTAVAIPTLMRSFRTYQLNDAASRLADMLKFTRFEAVRRNTRINFLIVPSGNDWLVGTDSNNNTTIDATEKQTLINGVVTLLPAAGLPSPASIIAKLGGTSSLTTLTGSAASVTFDARGAVTPLVAYVLYVGSPSNPDFGYRAVILLPSGATQIWTAPNGGTWQRIG
jgi:type II secretory pathway pseudopilin PulG